LPQGRVQGQLPQGIDHLVDAWSGLSAHDIYDTSWIGVLRSFARFGLAFMRGGGGGQEPLALVDSKRLRALLQDWLDFAAVRRSLLDSQLQHLCITAMNYANGESVAFVEGQGASPWQRRHRSGRCVRLNLEHVLASTAIPMLFPPQRIGSCWFGDGAMRQLHPLSAAMHLGAKRLLIIGVSGNSEARESDSATAPTPAQIAGHMLAREFIDNLEADIELAEKLNTLSRYLDPSLRADLDARRDGRRHDAAHADHAGAHGDGAGQRRRVLDRQPGRAAGAVRHLACQVIGSSGTGSGPSPNLLRERIDGALPSVH